MILRLSAKLGKKIGVAPAESLPLCDNAYLDWSGHLFRANRAQYVLLTNTASLFTIVFPGRGITTPDQYVDRVVTEIERLRARDDLAFARSGLSVPADNPVLFSKALNRSVIGSMNDQVFHAKLCLEEGGQSEAETADYLNRMPMLSLAAVFPDRAFKALADEGIK